MKPLIQLYIDTPDLDKAIETLKKPRIKSGINSIGLGKNSIKAKGINAVKLIKKEFPEKHITVDIDILGRAKSIGEALTEGAYMILLPGETPYETIANFVKKLKKENTRTIADLTAAKGSEELAKKLDGLGLDFFLINAEDIEQITENNLTPIAVRIPKLRRGAIAKAIEKADLLVIDTPIEKSGEIEKILDEIETIEEIETGLINHEENLKNSKQGSEEYLKEVSVDLDTIEASLKELEDIKNSAEKEKDLLKKDIENIQNQLSEILGNKDLEQEYNRNDLDKQIENIDDGWKKLKAAEAELIKRQELLEEENRIKWEHMLQEFKEGMKKQLSEIKNVEYKELEEKKLGIEKELEDIKQEWKDMETLWKKIDEDKKEIERRRGEINTEWEELNDLKKKKDTHTPAPEEEAPPEEILPDELDDVEKEWLEIENVWKKIEKDKKEINDKKEELNEEWERVKTIKKEILKDKKKISKELEEAERIKSLALSETQTQPLEDKSLQKEKDACIEKQAQLQKTHEQLELQKQKIKEEIERLEDEWKKIRQIKGADKSTDEIKKISNEALLDLHQLKSAHVKRKQELIENNESEEVKTRIMQLLEDRNEIKVKDASELLNLPEYTIRIYSNKLEEDGKIYIKAPLLGDMAIKKREPTRL